MVDPARFSIDVAAQGDVDVVRIDGVIDETSDLSPLGRLHRPSIRIDMRGVSRFSSYGVRAWLDAIREVPITSTISFVHCPPPVVDQCNMVSGFLGHGQIDSFYAPMACSGCEEQIDHLCETAACRANGNAIPETPCPRCGRPMALDDNDQFLLFMREG